MCKCADQDGRSSSRQLESVDSGLRHSMAHAYKISVCVCLCVCVCVCGFCTRRYQWQTTGGHTLPPVKSLL